MSASIEKKERGGALVNPSAATSRFLARAATTQAVIEQARVMLTFDATGSRSGSWDPAMAMQSELLGTFREAGEAPPKMRVSFFNGFNTYAATKWSDDAESLQRGMHKINCVTGTTQIERVLADAITQTKERKVAAVTFVGDAMEEDGERLVTLAKDLGRLGTPMHIYQEGEDPDATETFGKIARASGGLHLAFDRANLGLVKDSMKVNVAIAVGNRRVLDKLRADKTLAPGARALLGK